MWTHFSDMHSGGGCKEAPYEDIYIEAPQYEAELVFYNRFGHNPHRITCTCCGPDYAIYENVNLAQATGYSRNCDYDKTSKCYVEKSRYNTKPVMTIEEYMSQPDVLVIKADTIAPHELKGELPQQGYVWV